MNKFLKEDNENTSKQVNEMKLEIKNSGNQANASEEFIINRLEEMSDREGKVDEMDQPGQKKKAKLFDY